MVSRARCPGATVPGAYSRTHSVALQIFMSLFSMLPEAKSNLKKGGYSEQPAGFVTMGCFVAGFIGIQVISRAFHQFLPSHVVDCDHSHGEPVADEHFPSHGSGSPRHSSRARNADKSRHSHGGHLDAMRTTISHPGDATESTPLLPNERDGNGRSSAGAGEATVPGNGHALRTSRSKTLPLERRPSMMQMQKRVMSFVKDTKANCDESGPCFGYSDPCGQECFKHIASRTSLMSRPSMVLRTATGSLQNPPLEISRVEESVEDDGDTFGSVSPGYRVSRAQSRDQARHDHHHHDEHGHPDRETGECESARSEDIEAQHHHHVPENAFLSIGLQTSIAIALHKLPEGFITYATNHANPSLGFSVFLALFVHNISEGFSMALPLYMALHSRTKAMLWSSVLGGLSQPFGAGIAVLWFKVAKRTHTTPDSAAYGCLFALTAGIMASVALQLFVESLSLNHNRNLSIIFAFLGMTLLGVSNAFTSDAH